MKQYITLKDVALLAGVSYQTVSKVIHGNINVRAATEERVWDAVATLGYVPNESARSLRLTQANVIGYGLLPGEVQGVNPILEGFLHGMMAGASQLGFEIICFASTGLIDDDMVTYQNLFRSRKVGGFILSNIESGDARAQFLYDHQIPCVCFGNPKRNGMDYVDVSGFEGMKQTVLHLVNQGHTDIALLGWSGESRVGEERLQGFLQGIAESGLCEDNAKCLFGYGTVDSGYELTRGLLSGHHPTAICAMNDLMAIGAMYAVNETNLTIGGDIAICGFDDFPLTQYLRPSLTTVRQPAFACGQLAVEFLVDQIQTRTPGQHQAMLAPELVVRESSSKFF